MTDDDRREYLRHLEEIARNAHRSRQIDGVTWSIARHATRGERLALKVWLWVIGAR